MDSQQLKAFLAVARLQSFSQAADSLYLTQSAVSKRIQMLEQQLGTSLFDRHNRTITLTQAGQQLLPRAHQILNLMDDTEQDLANLSDQISGSLTFATSHHIGLHRLPPILQTYVRQYPAVQLNLEFRESERAYEMVRQRQVEFALTTLDDEADPLLSEILLWQDPMVCVCGIEHPLANRSSINLEDLAEHTAVLPQRNTITYRLLEQAFNPLGLSINSPMPTNYLETIKMMVSVGLGWSLLPESMIDNSLHRLEWPAPEMNRQLGVIHLKHRTLSNGTQAFIKLLQSHKGLPERIRK